MAKTLCISASNARTGHSQAGDIVQIEEDDYVWGPGHDSFDIKTIPGKKAEVISELKKLEPDTSGLDMNKESDKDRIERKKYDYRVVDDSKKTVAEMCESNTTIRA